MKNEKTETTTVRCGNPEILQLARLKWMAANGIRQADVAEKFDEFSRAKADKLRNSSLSVSYRSYQRVVGGKAVRWKTLWAVTVVLGVDIEEVIETAVENTEVGEEDIIEDILLQWLFTRICFNADGLPTQPELFYRASSEWQGWNQFFGTLPEDDRYKENERMDRYEGEAWKRFQIAAEKISTLFGLINSQDNAT